MIMRSHQQTYDRDLEAVLQGVHLRDQRQHVVLFDSALGPLALDDDKTTGSVTECDVEPPIRKLEAKLRMPRLPRMDHERLKAALGQRAEQWKAELRAEPYIARIVLRKLVGPLTLWDESERPDFVKWEATPTTELLAGLGPHPSDTSPTGFERLWTWSIQREIRLAA
jgi:hypothetical protein